MGVIRNRDARLQLHRARRFREESTYAEKRLWTLLRNRGLEGWKWRRQAPVGMYIVDFLSAGAALVIELDGEVHAGREAYDARRDAYLRRRGFRVLRLRNDEFLNDPSAALEMIATACASAHPLPRRGRGQGEDRLG